MTDWANTTLGELATFQNGYPFKPSELGGSTTPVIRIKQLLDPSAEVDFTDVAVPEKFAIDTGDLIFSWSGTLASVLWNRGPAFLNQHLFRVCERGGVDRRWLRYALEGAIGELSSKAHGTTMKHITKKNLLAHQIALPSVAEQLRIVGLMTVVDMQAGALEEETKRCNLAYQNATSMLWLDQKSCEAPGRPLSDVMRLNVERLRLNNADVYRSAGVLNAGQGLIDKGSFRGDETEYEAMNVLRAGQVVMRKLTAWEGPIAVVPVDYDGSVASNEFPTFTLDESASAAWMKHVCRTPRLWGEMQNRVTGTVQRRKRLNPDQLLDVVLPIPPREAQEQASSVLDGLDRQVVALRTELDRVREFRSSLLTALLNQEIEIPKSYDALLEEVS